jgi:hypothetical protein
MTGQTTPRLQLFLQLLDWSDSKRGRRVVFEIMEDPEDPFVANPFKDYTSRNGRIAGQIFAAALVEIDPETEQPMGEAAVPGGTEPSPAPVEAPTGPPGEPHRAFDELPAATQAALLCRNPEFQEYVAEVSFQSKDEESAAEYIREACQVQTRAALDRDAEARDRFLEVRAAFETGSRSLDACDEGE